MSEIQQLRDRVAELERVLGLTARFPKTILAEGTRMTLQCEKVLGLLMARNTITIEAAYVAVYGDRPECDQPSVGSVEIALYWLRKGLRPHGITIRNVYGRGLWYLDDADKAKIRALIEAQQ